MSDSAPRKLSFPATLVLAALAILIAITVVQWVLTSLVAIVKFVLVVVVVIGAFAWVISAKANR